ncbi:mechanosensitive ion channel family protein [Polymorphobacter sp.]|uniref:mechanosensitive ion channel family protein n=1 Tax=Polymorphobacter sp. TaxID=1909290 RepID=UPI003F6EBFDF
MTDLLQGSLPAWSLVWIITLAIVIGGCLIALALHRFVINMLMRLARRSASQSDDILINRLIKPTRWIAIGLGLSIALNAAPLETDASALIRLASGLIVPLLIGWLALAILYAFRDIVHDKSDISASDNLAARRRRTRITILARIGAFIIIFLTICMMLLSIPAIRNVGVTLMASAGLAGLAVGAAAQPALKNLIAGIQMAFSEPIRIDDVVIIEGEWGRIEEIRMTFVVVRIWDERRLVVPISQFLESSFQNWTRESSELLGTAFLYVDPTADVPALRQQLDAIVRPHPKWDGRVIGLQVTDIKPEVMELRALISAADAGNAFDLRCDVREAMMAYIASDMPDALPRRRAQLSGQLADTAAG